MQLGQVGASCLLRVDMQLSRVVTTYVSRMDMQLGQADVVCQCLTCNWIESGKLHVDGGHANGLV